MVGWEPRRSVYMNMGGRRLMLDVPHGFRADVSNPEKVSFVSRDYNCVLSFRVAVPGSGSVVSLSTALCRAWLSAELTDVRIQEEFSMTAANQAGPAFDLKCKVDGVVRASRVAFIPSPVGVLEFNSLSSPEKSTEANANLRFLLRCLRISDADGKLEIPPLQTAS